MLALQRERAADAVAPAALALGWGPEALLRPPAWRRDESELHALVRSHRHVVAAALDRAFIDGNFLGRAGARAEHNVRRVPSIHQWPGLGFGSKPPSFFVNETATTEIYTLSLHDALDRQ